MKGTIKANTADRYLRPIRKQIVELIEPNTSVVEYGCGNGDLLFQLSNKIRTGVGLDNSQQLILYAQKRQKREKTSNLSFKIADVVKQPNQDLKADYSISSLLFHVLNRAESINLLRHQMAYSKTVFICGFSKPENWKQNSILWLDQRFTKHYSNFRKYKNGGFMEGLLESIADLEYTSIETFDPVIKIYTIRNGRE